MKPKALAGIVIAIVLVIAGVWFMKRPASAPLTERTVKIGYFNQHMGSVPIFVAEEKGYFTSQNVKVELMPIASSNQMTDALVRGDIDIGAVSMIPVLNAEAVDPGKVKLTFASDMNDDAPFDRLVTKESTGIETTTSTKLKKIAVFPGTTATSFLKEYLKRQSVDVTKIEFVQMPPQNQLSALESGAVDAAYMFEPGLTIALAKEGFKPLTKSVFGAIYARSPIGGFGISSKFTEEHPALAQKTMKAIQSGITFESTNVDETRSIIAKRFNLPADVTAKMSVLQFKRFDELPPTFLSGFVDVLVGMGELKTKPDVSKVIYQIER